MAALTWDDAGKRLYETGIDRAVLYIPTTTSGVTAYSKGVAWNGLTGVTESPSGAEATSLYANNAKYLNLYSAEDLGITINAYTYPEEFEECDGSVELGDGLSIGQQNRKTFGLTYRTLVGNDTDGQDHGYKIHIVYGLTASPSEKEYASINDSPKEVDFSWECTSTPVSVTGHKPTSLVIIDSTKATAAQIKAIEDKLYGTASEEASLPLPDEIATIMSGATAKP